MLRSKRRIIPVFITAFWLVMMGLFLYREYGNPAPSSVPGLSGDLATQDQWMGIYLNDDNRVGYLRMQREPERRHDVEGYRLRLTAEIATTVFGVTAGMDIGGEAWTARSGERTEFDFNLNAADTRMGVRGTVADNRLTGFLNTGGEETPLDFPVDSNLMLSGGLGLPSDTMPDLRLGESASMDAFDPMTMKVSKATVTCTKHDVIRINGELTPARVYETKLGEMASTAWVNINGEVLQASTPFGFTLRKVNPSALLEEGDVSVASESADLIQRLAITPSGGAVFADARRLVLHVRGVSPEKFPHDPPWQQRDGDVLTVSQPPLPISNPTVSSDSESDMSAYLGADAFVTTNHPLVKEKVKEIVGGTTEPWACARMLYDWVYENVEKVPVLSVPNALDVLRTREGDCNEHTVLYTALARAAGVPARIAIGLVYSDTLQGFGYHAWPEVYVQGRWHPLDPTLGQLQADATHIKLLNGGIEKWVQLAGFIGQVKLDVIECE